MKRIKSFSDFSINESAMVDNDTYKTIMDAMQQSGADVAVSVYLGLQESAPEIFDGLAAFAKTKGTSLEDILAVHFKKDPSLLYMLDSNPDLKQLITQKIGGQDFSKLGKLRQMNII
jgi:hypothetical protein